MRHLTNRISQSAHSARIFQLDIFWPTLESIYSLKHEIAGIDAEENEMLRTMIATRTMIGLEPVLERQRELAARRAELLAETERKWALVHAGCQFMAMLLNEGRAANELMLTPEALYVALVRDGADIQTLEHS